MHGHAVLSKGIKSQPRCCCHYHQVVPVSLLYLLLLSVFCKNIKGQLPSFTGEERKALPEGEISPQAS